MIETPSDYKKTRRTQLLALKGDTRPEILAELRRSELVLGALWFDNVRELAWLDKADELGDFVTLGVGWPRQGPDIPARERSLFSWRIMQRKNQFTLSSVRLRYLNATVPGWQAIHRAPSFADRLEGCVDFLSKHKRMPEPAALDPEERTLAAWLAAQRASFRVSRDHESRNSLAFGVFNATQAQQLNDALPGWLSSASKHDVEWRRKAGELIAFVREEQRWPRASQSVLAQETALYRWHGMQVRAASGGTGHVNFGVERRSYLDDNLPGWNKKDPLAQ